MLINKVEFLPKSRCFISLAKDLLINVIYIHIYIYT